MIDQDKNLHELKNCILDFILRNNVENFEVGLIRDLDGEVVDCNIYVVFN